MPKRLTILGASARAAVVSALRALVQPLAIDLFADRDLVAACPTVRIGRYPAEFLPALAAAPEQPWIYTGGLENYPRLLDRLAALRPLWGNAGSIVRLVRDPVRLAEAAAAAGCSFPRTIAHPTAADRAAIAGGGWLVKPWRSSGGKSIRWARAGEAPATRKQAYWQEHVAGQSASAVFVAAAGRAMLLGATRQLHGYDFGLDRPFLYAGSIGPLALLPADEQRLTRLGNLLAERFGLVGLFNVDFLQREGQLCVLEVNPRYSASVEVLEQASGAAFLDWHLQACQEQRLPTAAPASQRQAGKAVVYAVQACQIDCQFENLLAEHSGQSNPTIADLPTPGARFAAGDPVVTVLSEADSPEEVEQQLRSLQQRVAITLIP